MLLCDIGNTSYHFLDGEKDYKKDVSSFNPALLTEDVYYICVNKTISQILKPLKNWIDLAQYVNKDNYYETMGIDRIVALQATDNAVVVDAGSAITVDVINKGVFKGGFIYPGINAMSKTYKDISPALEYPFNYEIDLNKLPKNSQDAISYGYLKVLYSEVTSHKLPIILTGGDAPKLQSLFEDYTIDEALIFKGMKNILIKL